MKKSCSETEIKEAMRLYQKSNLSSLEIAERFDISTGTLTSWAKELKIPLRGRGRRRYEEPTTRQREILSQAETIGAIETAKMQRVSKQAVYNIIKRWRGWTPPKGPQPHDVLLIRDRKVCVISNDGKGGGWVWDYKTEAPLRITSWVILGKNPKKVGVDNNVYPPLNSPNGKANGKANGHRINTRKK